MNFSLNLKWIIFGSPILYVPPQIRIKFQNSADLPLHCLSFFSLQDNLFEFIKFELWCILRAVHWEHGLLIARGFVQCRSTKEILSNVQCGAIRWRELPRPGYFNLIRRSRLEPIWKYLDRPYLISEVQMSLVRKTHFWVYKTKSKTDNF